MISDKELFTKSVHPLIRVTKNYVLINEVACNLLNIAIYDEIKIIRSIENELYIAVVTNTEHEGGCILRDPHSENLLTYSKFVKDELTILDNYRISELPIFDKKMCLDLFKLTKYEPNKQQHVN